MSVNLTDQIETDGPRRHGAHRFRGIAAVIVGATFWSAGNAFAESPAETADPLRERLARGLMAEEVEGDPAAAKREYEALLADHADQQAVAAAALFRLAEIHRRQGGNKEAIGHYQRLLREFPGAVREAGLARKHLAALGGEVPEVIHGEDEESMELERLRKLMTSSPDLVRKPDLLSAAAAKNQPRVMEFLLQAGVKPEPEVTIVEVAGVGSISMLKLLIEHGGETVKADLPKALALAAGKGYLEFVRELLSMGTEVDWQEPAGRSHGIKGPPLHAAIEGGHTAVMELLLEHGADPNQRANDTGYTALHVLAVSSLDDAPGWIGKLVEKGADVNALSSEPERTDTGAVVRVANSPLGTALRAMRMETAKALLEQGAKPDSPGLLEALVMGGPEVLPAIRLLLEAGADPNESKEGGVPLIVRVFDWDIRGRDANEHLAKHEQQVEAIALFLKHGADPKLIHGRFGRRLDVRSLDRIVSPFLASDAKVSDLSAGLFHQVLELKRVKGVTNLSLVKLLLDAGAVPGEEFPEVFQFVATEGSSVQRGGTSMIAGDGDPVAIAKALLAHRPDVLNVEVTEYAGNWHPGVKRLFFEEVLYPELSKSGGIYLCDALKGGSFQMLKPDEKSPGTVSLLLDKLNQLSGSGFIRFRRDGDGGWSKVGFDLTEPAELPDLAGGDIVEMKEGKPSEAPSRDLLHWNLHKRLPAIPVTFEVDGKSREILLRPDLLGFDPTRDEAPLVSAEKLARLLGQGLAGDGAPDDVTAGYLTVRRKGWADVRLDLSDSRQQGVPLVSGDHLVLERARPNEWPRSPGSVGVVVPGFPFVRSFKTYSADAVELPTLIQAIADVFSTWPADSIPEAVLKDENLRLVEIFRRQKEPGTQRFHPVVLPPLDLSDIRIRRLGKDGRDEVIKVDLLKAIRQCGEDTDPAEARAADVQLRGGDIVELALLKNAERKDGRIFTADEERFFRKVLSGRFVQISPDRQPEHREFRYSPPRLIETAHGVISLPAPDGVCSNFFLCQARGHVSADGTFSRDAYSYTFVDVVLTRKGRDQRVSTANLFLRDGDQIKFDQQPGSGVGRPRQRVTPPPPH